MISIFFSRYTSKGTTVYAIMTAKPPMPAVELQGPKASLTTKVDSFNHVVFLVITHYKTRFYLA